LEAGCGAISSFSPPLTKGVRGILKSAASAVGQNSIRSRLCFSGAYYRIKGIAATGILPENRHHTIMLTESDKLR
jgi:hypothetical protein